MADARARADPQHAVEDAVAGAQDRDEHDLLAVEHAARSCGVSGVSIVTSCVRHVARDLVGQQHADLAEQVAEGRVLVLLRAHQGQLVLHQRVIDDVDLTGISVLSSLTTS